MPMRTKASTGKIPQIYEFIKAYRKRFDVRTMCRVLEVAPSGYYAWLQEPICQRAIEDIRLLRLIRASFTASHGIYGAPRVFLDLREAGETCSKHRVMRLMRVNKIRAVRGYRIRHSSSSKPSELIPNLLKRNFDVASPKELDEDAEVSTESWEVQITEYIVIGDIPGDTRIERVADSSVENDLGRRA
jgi:putative transposase